MILDTTIIVDFLRGNEAATRKIAELENKNIPLVTTAITLFEAELGMTEHQRKRGSALWDHLLVLNFDALSAQEARKIHAALRKEGQVIEPEDSMIAGIAVVHHETIMTKNCKHFERIPHLSVETY